MTTKFEELPGVDAGFFKNRVASYEIDKVTSTNKFTFKEEVLSSGTASVQVITISTVDSSGYYYSEESSKKMIVLHFTAGYLHGDIGTLTKKNDHVSVSYVIARDGRVYRLFEDKYWSYHLGPGAVGGNEIGSKRSVGIELSNIGWLELKNDTELRTKDGTHYCNITDTTAYVKLDQPFREHDYFATFTDAQYTRLRELLKYLCAHHQIPYQFIDESRRYEILPENEASSYEGIASHVNFRPSSKSLSE
jgi:N-acetyl-anhydromuramyl-L-alanine amidase AmpD